MGEEERIIEEQIEAVNNITIEENFLPVENEVVSINTESELITVDTYIPEEVSITVSESVGSAALNVAADHSPYLPDQHTIGAITGLREELDEIERLKVVYSNEKNQGNYYLWEDENPSGENRDGFFVVACEIDNRIRICAAVEDVFGVTVSDAGFIGGQDVVEKNERYGLVVHSGVVGVRCETDVEINDYVVSNDYGIAKKTDGTCGYLVTAISEIDGVRHAIISLATPSTQMQKFSATVQDVAERMSGAEANIATAISVANAAYNKAQHTESSTNSNNSQIQDQLGGLIDKVGSLEGELGDLGDAVTSTTIIAEQAKNAAQETYSQAVNANKEATAYINHLVDALDPESEWTDEMGNNWREYLPQYIANGVPTKSEIYTLDGRIEDNKVAINKNAMGIETIVSSVDVYSVGEYSQAYGLGLSDMWNILKIGMIYIPTSVIHTESYEYVTVEVWDDGTERDVAKVYYAEDTQSYWYSIMIMDENNNPIYDWQEQKVTYANGSPVMFDKQEFTKGYYYTWNGLYWVESAQPLVYFSAEYPVGNSYCLYWYRDSNETLDYNGIIYEAYGLYKWDGLQWQKVNILSGNVTNRTTSRLIQTATEIAADVTNARSWLAHMGVKITEDGAFVDSVASSVIQTNYEIANGQTYASAEDISGPISGVYYAIGEVAPYDIYTWDGEKFNSEPMFYDGVYVMKPNTASIITAANKYGDASITLNADRINFDGVATFMQNDLGETVITGGVIQSGYIASHNVRGTKTTNTLTVDDETITVNDYKITKGILFDLSQGSIHTPHFTLDTQGRIEATSGFIGEAGNGMEIYEYGMRYMDGGEVAMSITPAGITLGPKSNRQTFLSRNGTCNFANSVAFRGSVDFSDATVTGINTTSVAVFG